MKTSNTFISFLILKVKAVNWFLPLLMVFSIQTSLFASEWRTFEIGNAKIRVEVVSTIQEQRRGLGNRTSIAEGTGMLFYFDDVKDGFMWMKQMLIPIDIVWIRQGRVIFIEEKIPPPPPMTKDSRLKHYGVGVMADKVLELPAGYVSKAKISIGDKVKLSQINPEAEKL